MSQVSIIDIGGNFPQIPTRFDANINFAIPIANVLEIFGDTVVAGSVPVKTRGVGNNITTEVQISQAIAASNAANVGLSAFNSAEFTVDANGFVSLIGGGAGIDSIQVDAFTAPGTNPVAPNGAGLITVTGAQVASGVIGVNVIRTNSLSANAYTIQIQRSISVASTDLSKNGVSHFNSDQFTVDGNGFVSLAGAGLAIDSIGVDATSGGGTNPVLPTAAGLITVNGATVAAGTNPVRSVSTAANVYQIQVQISQALAAADATKIGLCNFDSASFAVAATGFVTASGTGLGKTITGNTGGALSPTAGNWNILGNNTALNGFATYTTGSGSTLTVNSFGGNIWVVNPTAGVGTHVTIQAAVTAASAGDTIKVTAKSTAYSENITGKAGVNIVADTADAFTPNVIISGTLTHNTAGTFTVSGIRFQTNSAAAIAVTGTVASILNLNNCYINCTNNTGITFSSSSASSQINIFNSNGDVGTTGIGIFAHSASGKLEMQNSNFTNSGGSTTASTCSAGVLDLYNSRFLSPITTSSTGAMTWEHCLFSTVAQNVTAATLGGGSSSCKWCRFDSGSASSLSIGSAAANMQFCSITSSNAAAIAGAGTLSYSDLVFSGTSNAITVTTQIPFITKFGVNLSTLQPAFLANKSAGATDVTGNGAVYTVAYDTEIFDQGSNFAANTFTAPYTGRYYLSGGCALSSVTTSTTGIFKIVTSNRDYSTGFLSATACQDGVGRISFSMNSLCDMDVGDTATVTIALSGIAGNTADLVNAPTLNIFSGNLVC